MLFTNFPTPVSPTCTVLLGDAYGFAIDATCTGTPPTTTGIFQTGCRMIQIDGTPGSNLFYNAGTPSSVSWTIVGSGGGLPSLADSHIWVGDGTNVATARKVTQDCTTDNTGAFTVKGWAGTALDATFSGTVTNNAIPIYNPHTGNWSALAVVGDVQMDTGVAIIGALVTGIGGVPLGASVASPTKNNLISFNGTDYSTTPAGTTTAVAGAATLDNQNGQVVSEVLSTAAGSDYTLTLTSSAISSTSQILATVTLNSASAGLPLLYKISPGSGTCDFVIKNIDSTFPFNGSIKIKYFVL